MFSAAVLAAIEEHCGKRAIDCFDLISGTSTGGIIAIAIGLGVSAEDILTFYESKGEVIFPGTGLLHRTYTNLRHFIAPRRSQEVLRKAISSVIQERQLGESKVRLVIPVFNAVAGAPEQFRTAHHELFKTDCSFPATDIAVATSAAPTYYSAYEFPHNGAFYVDGGMWANCPTMVALSEATEYLDWPAEEIDILSIGTTSTPMHINAAKRGGGVLQWNSTLLDVLMAGQAQSAQIQAKSFTNGGFHRIDTVVERGRFSLDDARGIAELKSLGQHAAKNHLNTVLARFFTEPTTCQFVPIHLPLPPEPVVEQVIKPVGRGRSLLTEVLGAIRSFALTFFGYDVYISYKWADGRDYAKQLSIALKQRGFACWMDTDLVPGDRIESRINRNIRRSKTLVVIVTPESPTSSWVQREIRVFLQNGRPVIPIAVGTQIDESSQHFTALKDRLWLADDGQLPSSAVVYQLVRALTIMSRLGKRYTVVGAMILALVVCILAWVPFIAGNLR